MGSKRKQRQASEGNTTATADEASLVHVEIKGPSDPAPPIERDAGQIDVSALPERPFPASEGARHTRFQAVFKRSALKAIARHGQTKPDVEVCGVMVGNLYRDKAGPWLYVESIIRGDFAANKTANVTFTAETWQHIQAKMDARHPDQKILGWYHTHPGFGIFLSKMDLFIHENFFNLPWQTAFVHDPKSGEEGLFVWRKGLAEREAFLIEEDGDVPIEEEEADIVLPAQAQAATFAALGELTNRLKTLEKRSRSLIVGIALLALLALAWPFVLYTIMAGSQHPMPANSSPRQQVSDAAPPATGSPTTGPVLASATISPSPVVDRVSDKMQPATLPVITPVSASGTAAPPAPDIAPKATSEVALPKPIAAAPSPAPATRDDWIAYPKPEVVRPPGRMPNGAKILDAGDGQ